MKFSYQKSIFLLSIICAILFSINSFSKPIVETGIDVLIKDNFSEISGKRVILYTNSTGRTNQGQLTAEVLSKQKNFKLVSILTPEHGFFASSPAGEKVSDSELFGVKIHSLYGGNRKPKHEILNQADVILVDIQDIGVRSYTYISTMYKIMQAAAEIDKSIIILDRPNPIGGNNIDGLTLEKGRESFVGIVPISYIHGLTIGELAYMINEEGWLNDETFNGLKCNLKVIKMQNYSRKMTWEDTGLMWYPTSPNVPTVNSVRGLGMLGIFGELGFISIGIGTTTPFQYIGSPDFDWDKLNNSNDLNFDCIDISQAIVEPQFGMYPKKKVYGMFVNFKDCNGNFTPFSSGIKLFLAIRSIYPELFNSQKIKPQSKQMFDKVTGTDELFNALFNKLPDDVVSEIAIKGLDKFKLLRSKYLLYN